MVAEGVQALLTCAWARVPVALSLEWMGTQLYSHRAEIEECTQWYYGIIHHCAVQFVLTQCFPVV